MSAVPDATAGGAPVRVLLAEDEEHLGTILETFLAGRGVRVERARDGRAALQRLTEERFDVALLDVVMPEMDGLAVLRALGAQPAPPEAIIMTGNGTADTALAALAAGAYDYIAKPYRMAEVELLVRRAAEKHALRRRGALQRRALDGARGTPIGDAPAFRAAVEAACAAAAEGAHLLLVGERGAGRRTLACWTAGRGNGGGPAHVVRCDLPAAAARQALFGAAVTFGESALPAGTGRDERTIAGDPRLGVLELAAGETVVLAGLDALSPEVATELAVAVECRAFRRGGHGALVPMSARLVATAQPDVADRSPAHARLCALLGERRALLPPLRDRVIDILPLAVHLLRDVDASARLADDAGAALARAAWPGNVAELRAVLTVAAARSADGVVRAADLGAADAAVPARTALPLAVLERQQILDVLAEVGWHRGRAAARLGISPRTLYRKLRTFGVSRPAR